MLSLNQDPVYKSGLLIVLFFLEGRATPHYISNPAAGNLKVSAITEEQPCERGLTLGGTSACIHRGGATAVDTAPGSTSGIFPMISPQSGPGSL